MERTDLLIENCLIVPMNGEPTLKNGVIAVKNGRISFVGDGSTSPRIEAEKRIDAKGQAALPGLINCHTHVPMTLFRGIAEDKPLHDWLEKTIWPLEAKLKPEDIYIGALLGCLEMIKSGTTCFSDMYFEERMVASAVEESGIRADLAEGIIEAGDPEQGRKMLQKNITFLQEFEGYGDGRITMRLGPHSAYSCSSQLLSEILEKASELNVGIHIHLAESKEMSRKLEQECGSTEVEFLDDKDLFRRRVLAAHSIDLSPQDMSVLARRGVDVAYVPVANMKLGLNVARIDHLLGLGVNVGLGTDGPASNNTLDMFETMKIAALLQKQSYSDPTVLPSQKVVQMATIDGARALGLEKDIGSLQVGKKADIILVDLFKPHLKPLHDIYANIVYSMQGGDVTTVIIDGKVVMENREVKTINERAVMEKAEKTAWDLVSR
ncbi:MAG: amidohydrolase [Thermoproteota archaeon]